MCAIVIADKISTPTRETTWCEHVYWFFKPALPMVKTQIISVTLNFDRSSFNAGCLSKIVRFLPYPVLYIIFRKTHLLLFTNILVRNIYTINVNRFLCKHKIPNIFIIICFFVFNNKSS